MEASDTFTSWHQRGYKGDLPGSIRFESASGILSMTLSLHSINGLYYCPLDVLAVDSNPIRPTSVSKVSLDTHIPHLWAPSKYKPVPKDCQLESEVWSLRIDCPSEDQLDVLPSNVPGLPSVLEYHPFRFVDFHAQARIQQQAAQRLAVRVEKRCREFHMDFGFMRASANDYTQPSKTTNRVVLSYNGFSSYLIVVDAATRFIWVFLTKLKEPP